MGLGKSVEDIVRDATEALKSCGIDSPQHDSMVLLAFAASFGLSVSVNDIRTAMILGSSFESAFTRWNGSDELSLPQQAGDALDLFAKLLQRRIRREPLQYIVGHARFRFLDVLVGTGVFIPRQETELVVQAALDWLQRQKIGRPVIVDLCSGSGAIAVSVATEVPHARVYAVEQSERTIEWTRKNIQKNQARIDEIGSSLELIEGDATSVQTLQSLDGYSDVIICNPPYIPEREIPAQPEVRDWEPQQALYGGSPDGLRFPKRIIDRAATLLKVGGVLVMEHDILQGAALRNYALAQGYRNAQTEQDLTHRDRFLIASRQSQANTSQK
ncbi:MAG: peptide chain release factor N(5)-glutamine methyltransferase [Bifidobacterium aquikefiri]|uniref:peptide chain release factor N(5)-glutamine methyltransferase n=1 Tax=Bifidobacterium aquikefiri TaxID=1653207 RepID=UPI0039E73CCC